MQRFALLIVCAVFFITSIPSNAYAQVHHIVAEGTYIMGDGDTRQDAEKHAVENAMRIAIQKAGTYIESYSKMQNKTITHDEVTAISSAIIQVVAQSTSFDTESNWICHAIINADIDDSNIDIDKILAARREDQLAKDKEVQRLRQENSTLEEKVQNSASAVSVNGISMDAIRNAQEIILDARNFHDYIKDNVIWYVNPAFRDRPTDLMFNSAVVRGQDGTVAVSPRYRHSKYYFHGENFGRYKFARALDEIPKFTHKIMIPVLDIERKWLEDITDVGPYPPIEHDNNLIIDSKIAMNLPELIPEKVWILY